MSSGLGAMKDDSEHTALETPLAARSPTQTQLLYLVPPWSPRVAHNSHQPHF